MFEIKVPGFGESIQEVQVANWLKEVGDVVKKDEDLVELESEKASQNLASDFDGVLAEIKIPNGEFAAVGDVLCIIKEGDAGGAVASRNPPPLEGPTRVPQRLPCQTHPQPKQPTGSCRPPNEFYLNIKSPLTRSPRRGPAADC